MLSGPKQGRTASGGQRCFTAASCRKIITEYANEGSAVQHRWNGPVQTYETVRGTCRIMCGVRKHGEMRIFWSPGRMGKITLYNCQIPRTPQMQANSLVYFTPIARVSCHPATTLLSMDLVCHSNPRGPSFYQIQPIRKLLYSTAKNHAPSRCG